jgi:dipeptidyl aminopeptidase/acylaminoacyl peptidase
MGEVYRARDARLGREVAIKVLPEGVAESGDRRARFEQEARAASALNHPSIVTLHDIGQHDGVLWVAMELVDGKTLREMLEAGALPTRKALDVGVQIAEGLARAHAAGIVHRDLKPENVMITRDGLVKLLDFGLAKLSAPFGGGDVSDLPTAAPKSTAPGIVMGTVGYMSPEQAAGRVVDYRSDQFSLGTLLYELAAGRSAFKKDTPAETLAAVIREDPQPLSASSPRTPAPYRWIVERCLAKDPEDRYASTKDLARDLKSVRDHLSEATVTGESSAAPMRAPAKRMPLVAVALAAALVAGAGAYALGRRATPPPSQPHFRRLTFQRGTVNNARFAPGGSVVYGAAWEGNAMRLYSIRTENALAAAIAAPDADLLSMTPSGELAISIGSRETGPFLYTGTLARLPISGGTPREILANVEWADFAPDGQTLAIVHTVGGRSRLEMPVGKVLAESAGWISHPRVSPRGDAVAFLEHPVLGDDAGRVVLVDLAGKKRVLADNFGSVQGLAFAPDASEVYFSGTPEALARAIHAVTLSGKDRVVLQLADSLTLADVGPDRRLLVIELRPRMGLAAVATDSDKPKELAWLDYSLIRDLSRDGQTVLFDEAGEAGGVTYSMYLRRTDGSPAVRLAEGASMSLSWDGQWVLARSRSESELRLVPTGPGEGKRIPIGKLHGHESGAFLPDGKAVLFNANEEGKAVRFYYVGVDGGTPRAVSPDAAPGAPAVSPDGKSFVTRAADGRLLLCAVDGSAARQVPGSAPGDCPSGFSADGRTLYVYQRGVAASLFRIDMATGKRDFVRTASAPDPAGVESTTRLVVTPDGKRLAYSYELTLSDLFLVDGVK